MYVYEHREDVKGDIQNLATSEWVGQIMRKYGGNTTKSENTQVNKIYSKISFQICKKFNKSMDKDWKVTWTNVSMFYVRGVKLIFTRGHISLAVAFKGPNVMLGLYKRNYSLTVKWELGTATR